MAKSQETLVFLSAKRTPFGSYGGSLKEVNPSELGLAAAQAALDQSKVAKSDIDHVIFGNVLHCAPDSIYTPRHIGLKLGIPMTVPALGLNRLCGSGFQAIVEAYQQMAAGDTRIALVGGVENMSMSPFAMRGVRWGVRMGHQQLTDTMMEALFDTYTGTPMAITAEKLATQYGITRVQADEFAFRSQRFCKAATAEGRFKAEIAPFATKDRKGNLMTLDRDEHPKPETTLEILSKLKAVFQKDGVVTAGNASGIVDGACALMVATESEARTRGLTPMGRLVSYGVVGCDPTIMGIGPAPAARMALDRAGLKLAQMDLIEVNEAFAAQALAVQKELGIPDEIFNVDGGAVAIGHPLGASGARITTHLLHELKRRGKRYGLGAACIGGGQGIALVVEVF